jgi:hypothetical protein
LAPALNRFRTLFLISALAILMAASATIVSVPAIRGDEKPSPEPWTSAQVVQPGALAHELDDKNGAAPTVAYVGFHTLFAGGHIPGAAFQGPASTEKGLANLKKWADGLPRTANLVIYCGCCPFEKCPNVRPAFTALSGMGFKKLRVLVLPTSLVEDWVNKGFLIQRAL